MNDHKQLIETLKTIDGLESRVQAKEASAPDGFKDNPEWVRLSKQLELTPQYLIDGDPVAPTKVFRLSAYWTPVKSCITQS